MNDARVIFGGTFDPVHEGHLMVARAAQQRLNARVHFLPAGDPPHRTTPHAPAAHRLAMLKLALAGEPTFALDTRELHRAGPSWTINTVEALRDELPSNTPIVLVIGMDCLHRFTTWQRWQDILAQAHLLVCARPGEKAPSPHASVLSVSPLVTDASILTSTPGGCILLETTTTSPTSASDIRATLATQQPPCGLPTAVYDYIKLHHLYHPANFSGATAPT